MSLTTWTDAIHEFRPGHDGRCTSGWANDAGEWVQCNSSQRSSTLHDDCESDFRQAHDHGGGDCMCFEDDNRPSYHEVMRMTCYPTPEEIAEEERALVRASRRSRRLKVLSDGKVITRLGQSLSKDTPGEEMARIMRRAQKLHGWGVRA